MTPDEIRQSYLDFFEARDHRIVDSSPVVPHNDPTLLFTNAGMNQFKDLLLGHETRDYDRATSAQKCIRAGGKHNDLDEVGKSGRHLTFFEMLGNWSFGDYYKQQAIEWAWEFVREVLGFERERLYVTTYKDDDESYRLWTEHMGLPEERVLPLGDVEKGDEENFWSMGPTGPCGPCTEIHYDLRPEESLEFEPGYDENRVIEIWNLVFMEFNRDETGNFEPLPMQSVDTGMGLDRVAMIEAGSENVFQSELFLPIMRDVLSRLPDGDDAEEVRIDGRSIPVDALLQIDHEYFTNLSVVADHIRSLTFALCDGAKFSNEGRGYVLRRILRRAVRYGRDLGFTEPFLCNLVDVVVDHYGHVYPEIEATGEEASELIRLEEERFLRNIDRGIELFEEAAERAESEGREHLTGEEVFKLHATYGFPPDLTELMAEERQLAIDWDEYEELWAEHQETSKAEDVYEDAAEVGEWTILHERSEDSRFVGYDETNGEPHDPLGCREPSLSAETVATRYRPGDEDDTYQVLLEKTPFYAESGGQVGDTGTLAAADGSLRLRVRDTQETSTGVIHDAERVDGEATEANLSKSLKATVDASHRRGAAAHHTATHLLHYVLRDEISDNIFQSGSLVTPDRLRFDFSFDRPLTDEELRTLEDRVNAMIRSGIEVDVYPSIERERAIEEMDAMAIFGETYDDEVRVIEIVDDETDLRSVELCGGTHVESTRDLNLFRISRESGVAAGIRRIEAVTGRQAYEAFQNDRQTLEAVADRIGTEVDNVVASTESLLDDQSELERQVDSLSQRLAHADAAALADETTDVQGVPVVSAQVDVETRDQLRTYADRLRDELDRGAALLGADIDGSAALVCLVIESTVHERDLAAGFLVQEAAGIVGGGGGGRPTLAQAGGPHAAQIPEAIEAFPEIIDEQLGD